MNTSAWTSIPEHQRWHFAVLSQMEGGGEVGKKGEGLLTEPEIKRLEKRYSDGLTAAQLVDIFVSRGLRFSEATLRKYVQLKLLPRSKRVGRKGKHRGSLGLYPVRTIGRINEVKRLMRDGFTIEEIAGKFFRYADDLDGVKEAIDNFFGQVRQLESVDSPTGTHLEEVLSAAEDAACELLEQLETIAQLTVAVQEDIYRGSGAAESAEDLL